MKSIKKNRDDQIEEIIDNQNHILEAVRNLNAQLQAIEGKVDDDKMNDLKEIMETQAMIDEVLVNNSEDIALLNKMKQEIIIH